MLKNENRPGYKKTKVGWIPKDWDCAPLGQVFKKRTARGKRGVPVFSVTQDRGMVLRATLDRKTGNDVSADKSLLVEPGDVAYNMMRMWQGAVAVCKERCVISPAYVVCRPNADQVDSDFMFNYFKSLSGMHMLCAYSYGLTADRLRLYYEDFSLVPAPLPSLSEQKAIAYALECWDKAVRTLAQKIANKRRIKKGLTQKLLSGQTRHAVFSKPWKSIRLFEILKEHKEISSGAEAVHSVSVHKGVVNQVEHLGRSFSAKDTSNYNLVKPGDIVYTKSPTGDFPYGIIRQSKVAENVIVSPLYGVFTPITKHMGLILDCFFESPINASNYLRPLIRKGAKNTINITNTTFLSGQLRLPLDKDEQLAIAKVLSSASKEIEMLERKLSLLKDQKRFLLNNLVTGTIRLPQFCKAARKGDRHE